jgi:nitrogenase molybdenum-iron protein alpha/beta subunit
MKVEATLEDFSLAPVAHTGLFGVFLGVHAIEDGLCVLHAGVGCKSKTQARLVHHDLGRESHTRVGWTELSEEELIRDPGERLPQAIAELFDRRKPRVIVLIASTAVEYSGVDLTALAERAKLVLGCPVIHIPGVSAMPDFQHGYAAVIRAMLSVTDWTAPPVDRVSLVGYLFHRHELEQAANLAELKRLVGALGARLGPADSWPACPAGIWMQPRSPGSPAGKLSTWACRLASRPRVPGYAAWEPS